MTQELLPQISNLAAEMRALGADLLAWRDDKDAQHLHSKADLKTEADRRAHRRLVDVLATQFAGVPVISEEDSEHLSDRPERYWLIDPIDGTASWLHGFDGFVTQAALIENNVPVLGLVYAPALDLFYTAARGEGAFLNGARLPQLASREGLVLIDNTPQPHGLCAALMDKMDVTGYIESGSLGLKSCRIADGGADLFVKDVVVRDWDLAPAAVLFSEIGGQLRGIDGQNYAFSGDWQKPKGFIAARTTEIVDQCVNALNALGNWKERR